MRIFVSFKNVTPGREKRRLLIRGWVLLYISLIFILTPYAPTLWEFLKKKTGLNFVEIMSFFGIGVFVLLYYFLFKTKTYRAVKEYFVLAGVFLCYIIIFLFFTQHPIEQFHLFEYGFLSYLIYQALAMDIKGKKLYGWGMVIIILVGIFDEVFQCFLPQRFGDIRDVFLNCFSGLLGFAIIATLIPEKMDR